MFLGLSSIQWLIVVGLSIFLEQFNSNQKIVIALTTLIEQARTRDDEQRKR